MCRFLGKPAISIRDEMRGLRFDLKTQDEFCKRNTREILKTQNRQWKVLREHDEKLKDVGISLEDHDQVIGLHGKRLDILEAPA